MTTLVAYCEAGSGAPNTTVDGNVRRSAQTQTWSAIRDAATGTHTSRTGLVMTMMRITAATSTDLFADLTRGVTTFNTTSVPSNATITNVTLAVRGSAKLSTLVTTSANVVGVTLANNNDIATADYNDFGGTALATMAYASWSSSADNSFSPGNSSVVKGGVTAYGWRMGSDLSNTAPTWSSGADSYFSFVNADNGSNPPSLTVVYTVPTGRSFAAIL